MNLIVNFAPICLHKETVMIKARDIMKTSIIGKEDVLRTLMSDA